MFVRTENGIYEVVEEVESVIIDNKVVGYNCYFNYCDEQRIDFIAKVEVIKSSDSLEELIKGGDLIIVSNNDNKLPMIYEKYHFDLWVKNHDNIISKMEWYIKVGNNYKLVATKQDKGEWELL